jgi:hypothetical protein
MIGVGFLISFLLSNGLIPVYAAAKPGERFTAVPGEKGKHEHRTTFHALNGKVKIEIPGRARQKRLRQAV